MHFEAADDSPTVEQSVVATRLLPVVELLLREVVDADDLAEEIAGSFAHDADVRRTRSNPKASVGSRLEPSEDSHQSLPPEPPARSLFPVGGAPNSDAQTAAS
jgi:hypothetical protein